MDGIEADGGGRSVETKRIRATEWVVIIMRNE